MMRSMYTNDGYALLEPGEVGILVWSGVVKRDQESGFALIYTFRITSHVQERVQTHEVQLGRLFGMGIVESQGNACVKATEIMR